MSQKLPAVNSYLRDRAMRERMVLKSVATSSAIEGIRAPFRRTTEPPRKVDATTPRRTRKQPRTRG